MPGPSQNEPKGLPEKTIDEFTTVELIDELSRREGAEVTQVSKSFSVRLEAYGPAIVVMFPNAQVRKAWFGSTAE